MKKARWSAYISMKLYIQRHILQCLTHYFSDLSNYWFTMIYRIFFAERRYCFSQWSSLKYYKLLIYNNLRPLKNKKTRFFRPLKRSFLRIFRYFLKKMKVWKRKFLKKNSVCIILISIFNYYILILIMQRLRFFAGFKFLSK